MSMNDEYTKQNLFFLLDSCEVHKISVSIEYYVPEGNEKGGWMVMINGQIREGKFATLSSAVYSGMRKMMAVLEERQDQ